MGECVTHLMPPDSRGPVVDRGPYMQYCTRIGADPGVTHVLLTPGEPTKLLGLQFCRLPGAQMMISVGSISLEFG